MKESDFVNPNGAFEKAGGSLTFVPRGLPPQYGRDRVNAVSSEATESLALLDGAAANIPPVFDALFAAREANYSCLIEGITSSARLIFTRSAGLHDGVDAVLAQDCADAIRQCTDSAWLDGGIGVDRILLAHGIAMRRYGGTAVSPGRFRAVQNWIGLSGCSMADASYVPPAPARVEGLMAGLAEFIGRGGTPVPVLCAMAHHHFESIHPFIDGNGRTGRLLVQMILSARGSLRRPLLCMSAYLWRNRKQYYDLLRKVNEAGSWDEWVSFFIRGMTESCVESVDMAGRLSGLHARYVHLTGIHKARELADSIFRQPVTTAGIISTDLGIDQRTAEMILDRTRDAGIVQIVGNAAGKKTVYVAEAVLAEIE